MDIDERGYWKPHVSNSPALSVTKHQKLLQHIKKENNVSIDSLII
jgi:hypothetical protein